MLKSREPFPVPKYRRTKTFFKTSSHTEKIKPQQEGNNELRQESWLCSQHTLNLPCHIGEFPYSLWEKKDFITLKHPEVGTRLLLDSKSVIQQIMHSPETVQICRSSYKFEVGPQTLSCCSLLLIGVVLFAACVRAGRHRYLTCVPFYLQKIFGMRFLF